MLVAVRVQREEWEIRRLEYVGQGQVKKEFKNQNILTFDPRNGEPLEFIE